MTTSDEAQPCDKQITSYCQDCPFRRDAIPGWLGDMDIDEWIEAAHGETQIDCHAFVGPQCAGAAIYRANVLKTPRSRELLVLPANREKVFARPNEFREHHEKMGKK